MCDINRSERGAFLPIMALLAVVLIVFLGMPIDTGMLATTTGQYQHSAEFAVVSAMERYLESTANSRSGRFAEATTRANQILNEAQNLPSALGQGYFKVNQESFAVSANNDSGANGKLIPGNWDSATRAFTPVGSNAAANAMRIELRPREDAPLKTVFMRVLGIESNTFTVSAIAYASPLHVVAIADLSHSATYDTHWKTDIDTTVLRAPVGPIKRSEFALQVTSATPALPNSLSVDATKLGVSPRAIYDALEVGRPMLPPDYRAGRLSSVAVSRHYKEDVSTASVRTVAFNSGAESYVFNTVVAPEPLTSMTASLRRMQDLLMARNVDGDRMAILGADDDIHNVRVMGDLSVSPSVMVSPDLTDAEFASFRTAFQPYDPAGGDTVASYAARVAAVGFFPRSRNFNLPRALDRARVLLDDNRQPDVKEIVILLSSGISNCRNVSGASDCRTEDSSWIESSLNDADGIVQHASWMNPATTDRPISLHVLLMGTAEGASTLVKRYTSRDRADNLRHCMPDWLARQVGTTFVNSAWDSGADDYFFSSNRLYDMARATNALYFPLRACCSLNGCSCASGAELRAAIDFQASCSSAGGDLSLLTSFGNTEVDKYLEASRLLCDPFGRRKQDQAEQAMSEILGGPSIMLLKEGV